MLIESEFIVPLPLDQVWNLLDGQRDRTGRRESPVCRRHLWPGRGGKGEVQATVTTRMAESADGTTVNVVDDIRELHQGAALEGRRLTSVLQPSRFSRGFEGFRGADNSTGSTEGVALDSTEPDRRAVRRRRTPQGPGPVAQRV